jgi:uncharacterized YccA/Bax inhibitor family protein
MSSPLLNESAIERVETSGGIAVMDRPADAGPTTVEGAAPPPRRVVTSTARSMSYGGVTSAAGLMLVVLAIGGWFGWQTVTETTGLDVNGQTVTTASITSPGWLIGGLIVGLGLAFLTAFKPHLAPFTSLPYAIAEGVVVGCISALYNARFEGIVLQAILATMGVFLVMITLYGLRILRATPRFVKGVIGATFGILLMYVAGFVASLFGVDMDFWNSPSPLGIGISVVIVIVAALNLIIDFDVIERGVNERWPARMDWYGAFALIVTLVWLYLEMLRLLAKLRQN